MDPELATSKYSALLQSGAWYQALPAHLQQQLLELQAYSLIAADSACSGVAMRLTACIACSKERCAS